MWLYRVEEFTRVADADGRGAGFKNCAHVVRSLRSVGNAEAVALQRWHWHIGITPVVDGGPPSPAYKVRGLVRVPSLRTVYALMLIAMPTTLEAAVCDAPRSCTPLHTDYPRVLIAPEINALALGP